MEIEARVHKLVQQVSDLEARRLASDAVVSQLLALTLVGHPDPDRILDAVRKMTVTASAADMSAPNAENDVQVMRLKTEQYIQDLVDQIERVVSPLRR